MRAINLYREQRKAEQAEKLLLWWVVLKSSCAHYGVCMQGLSEVDPHAENCVCINRTADKEKNQTEPKQIKEYD